ncbi:hypothetical protein ACET3Z_007716 [Daucus carota]
MGMKESGEEDNNKDVTILTNIKGTVTYIYDDSVDRRSEAVDHAEEKLTYDTTGGKRGNFTVSTHLKGDSAMDWHEFVTN